MNFPNFLPIRIRTRLIALSAALALTVAPCAQALDLIQSFRLALEQDARYQSARADTQAVRESAQGALAQMLPNVSSNLWRGHAQTNSQVPGQNGPVGNSYDYYSSTYGISLHQAVYRKYSFAQYQQAKSQVASAEATLDKNLQDMLVRLAGAYFDALMAGDQLDLIKGAKMAYAAQLQAMKRSFELGQGTRTDIDDAQARYDMIVAQELEAAQNVDFTLRAVEVIINRPAGSLVRLDPARLQLVAPMPARIEDWIARGDEVSPDMRAARANVESAAQELEKARSGHTPTVDLVLSRTRSQSANDTTIHQTYLTNQVGLQVNIPIFSGGYVDAQERQALANLEKYKQNYEVARRDLGQQMRKEFRGVTEGVLKVKALEQAERSSDQAVFSSQKGFQAGTRTLVDILNAEQQRLNVRRDLAQARYAYIVARLRLQGLVNSLDENELGTINGWLSAASTAEDSAAK